MGAPAPPATALIEQLRAAEPHCNHHANAGLCHEAADWIDALLTSLEAAQARAGEMEQALRAIVEANRIARAALNSPLDGGS